jgi:hypothetical protein
MGCPAMPNVTHFQPVAWWWTRRQIGRVLRERYNVLKDLPPKLLTLIGKLDAIEGKYLLHYAPPLGRRSVEESDWLPPRFVWQNDADLFAS